MKRTLSDDINQEATGIDYSIYHMRFHDRLIAFLAGFTGAAIATHIFFNFFIITVIAGAVMGIYSQKIYRSMLIKRQQKELVIQFKDFLDVLNAAVSSGMTTVPAFMDAEIRLINQFGESASFCQELII